MDKNTKILITGVKGQLGFDVQRELIERGYVNVLGVSHEELDITNEFAVRRFMEKYRPEIVFHNAAFTDVDKAEKKKDEVYKINALATKYIAEECAKINAKIVYISTDYVFSGKGEQPFEVLSPKNPISVYGFTKSKGEDFITEFTKKYFIVRISWAFGLNGNNFIKTMLRLADEGNKQINVVNDQIGSPTYTYDLSKFLIELVKTERYGIYHATNEGFCSWAELAKAVFIEAKRDVDVHEVSTKEYRKIVGGQANRPLNCRLSKASLIDSGFSPLPTWQDALKRYIRTLSKEEK